MLKYLIFVVAGLGLAYFGYRRWRKRIDAELREGAATEYEQLRTADPDLIEGMSEDRFADVFAETHRPRFPAYLLLTISIFLLGTPLVLSLLNWSAYMIGRLGAPTAGQIATDLYINAGEASVLNNLTPEAVTYILEDWGGFYFFFGLLGFWIALVYVMMRRYHRRSPGSLREEVLRAR